MKMNNSHQYICVIMLVCLALFSCQKQDNGYKKLEPAHLEKIENSDVKQLTLTSRASERIGIKTSEIVLDNSDRLVVPYSAVLYDPQGKTWVYLNSDKNTFQRAEIIVDFIESDKAILTNGPDPGAVVVTQGAAELLGTEYEVGH